MPPETQLQVRLAAQPVGLRPFCQLRRRYDHATDATPFSYKKSFRRYERSRIQLRRATPTTAFTPMERPADLDPISTPPVRAA